MTDKLFIMFVTLALILATVGIVFALSGLVSAAMGTGGTSILSLGIAGIINAGSMFG